MTTEQDAPPPNATRPSYDPPSTRATHRVCVLYAVDSQAVTSDLISQAPPVSAHLDLDRLRPAYDEAQRQFPRIAGAWSLDGVVLAFADAEVISSRMWIFTLPNGRLVLALTVNVLADHTGLIAVLEDLHHRRLTIDGASLWETARSMAPAWLDPIMHDGRLALETYNLVHLGEAYRDWAAGSHDVRGVSGLIYRFDTDYRAFSPRIEFPDESNRGNAFAATGPYVGLTARSQGYIENSLLVSAVLFVGAMHTLRSVREQAFRELQRARNYLRLETPSWGVRTHRDLLNASSRNLARLQLELSSGVEAFERMASTVPSLRVTDFHESLFRSAHIAEETATIGTILDRISAAIAAETTRRQAIERQDDERRTLIRSVALSVITTVALPLGIIFGFFGMGSRDIQSSYSVLDIGHYAVFYALLAVTITSAVLLGAVLYLRLQRHDKIARRKLEEVLSLDL